LAEIARRKARVREAPIPEHTTKLQQSEAKMIEHKASMAVLGKEAATALAAVESQQQRVTLQRLVGVVRLLTYNLWLFYLHCLLHSFISCPWQFVSLKVEAEKLFHLRLAAILDDVEAEVEFSLFTLIAMGSCENSLAFLFFTISSL
jgi:hypothetical protein